MSGGARHVCCRVFTSEEVLIAVLHDSRMKPGDIQRLVVYGSWITTSLFSRKSPGLGSLVAPFRAPAYHNGDVKENGMHRIGKHRSNVYRNGRVHVQSRMCDTCIFRPGNGMQLRRGRVAQMVRDATRLDSCIPVTRH